MKLTTYRVKTAIVVDLESIPSLRFREWQENATAAGKSVSVQTSRKLRLGFWTLNEN